jgi:hypothetical protein
VKNSATKKFYENNLLNLKQFVLIGILLKFNNLSAPKICLSVDFLRAKTVYQRVTEKDMRQPCVSSKADARLFL